MVLASSAPGMLLLLAAVSSSVCAMWCYPANSTVSGSGSPAVCIGAHDLGTGNTEFTIFAAVSGWVGFGVGTSSGDVMGPADVFVAYPDSSSSTGLTVQSCINYGPGNISVNSISVWSQVALNTTIPQPSWAPLAVSVVRSNAASGSYGQITAWSSALVTQAGGGGISIPYHRGNHSGVSAFIAANAASGIIALPSGISRSMLVTIHVILMSLSLVAMPSAGIFIAMFLREKLGRKWVGVHVGIMIGGVGFLSVASGIFMILFKPGQIMGSVHEILGILILGLVLVEIGLGFAVKSSVEGSSSAIARSHRYFGLILAYIVVPVQVALGFMRYSTVFGSSAPIWLIVVPTSLFVIGVVCLLIGYFTLPHGDDLGLSNMGEHFDKKIGTGPGRNFVELEENVTDVSGSRNGRHPPIDLGPIVNGGGGIQNGYNYGGIGHNERIGSGNGRNPVGMGGSGNGRVDDAPDRSKDYNSARHAPPRSQNSRGNDYPGSTPARGGQDYPGQVSGRRGDYPGSAPPRRAQHGQDYVGSTNGRGRQEFSSKGGPDPSGLDYPGSANGRTRGDGVQTRMPSQTRLQSRTRRPHDEF
ncbi:hypothetical protein HDU84_006567 [Entophlyctis sp. JEL0112]|nr:hypothetical protein HDU84_006567 [Entophlyctis sp. JEL0112]